MTASISLRVFMFDFVVQNIYTKNHSLILSHYSVNFKRIVKYYISVIIFANQNEIPRRNIFRPVDVKRIIRIKSFYNFRNLK